MCSDLRNSLLPTTGLPSLLDDVRSQLLTELRTTLAPDLRDALIADRREPLVDILYPPLFDMLVPQIEKWVTAPMYKNIRAATTLMAKDVTPHVQAAVHTALCTDLLAPLQSALEVSLLEPLLAVLIKRLPRSQPPPDRQPVSLAYDPQIVETSRMDALSGPSGFSSSGSLTACYRNKSSGEEKKRKRTE